MRDDGQKARATASGQSNVAGEDPSDSSETTETRLNSICHSHGVYSNRLKGQDIPTFRVGESLCASLAGKVN